MQNPRNPQCPSKDVRPLLKPSKKMFQITANVGAAGDPRASMGSYSQAYGTISKSALQSLPIAKASKNPEQRVSLSSDGCRCRFRFWLPKLSDLWMLQLFSFSPFLSKLVVDLERSGLLVDGSCLASSALFFWLLAEICSRITLVSSRRLLLYRMLAVEDGNLPCVVWLLLGGSGAANLGGFSSSIASWQSPMDDRLSTTACLSHFPLSEAGSSSNFFSPFGFKNCFSRSDPFLKNSMGFCSCFEQSSSDLLRELSDP
ncbi:hypothetical protein EK904_012985 [Melospiza melodia maxima]|nr:hypothetical protein EK904_012985 [Melospiza melodia maxima]